MAGAGQVSGWLVERLIELPLRLDHATARVLYVLGKHADDDGSNCYPSFDTIEEMAQVSRTTVARAISLLRDLGIVMLERAGNGRRGARYRINLAAGMPKQAQGDKPATPDLFPETVAPVDHKPKVANTRPKARSGSMVHRSGSITHRSGSTTLPDSNQTQTKTQKEPPNPPALRVVAGTEVQQVGPSFEEFYAAYPRKKARPRALRAWNRLKPADRAAAYTALAGYQFNPEPTLRPHPATWLNERYWEDPPEAPRARKQSDQERLADLMRRASEDDGPIIDARAYSPASLALGGPR